MLVKRVLGGQVEVLDGKLTHLGVAFEYADGAALVADGTGRFEAAASKEVEA